MLYSLWAATYGVVVPRGMAGMGGNRAISQVVVCEAGLQRYALPFEEVIEVAQAVACHPLPGAPAVVEGVINYRGTLVPCVPLRARFSEAPKPLSATDTLIIARSRDRVVALRVDGAVDIARLDQRRIASAAALRGAAPSIAGAVALEDGLLLVCDLAVLLDAAERTALEHAMAQQQRATGGADG